MSTPYTMFTRTVYSALLLAAPLLAVAGSVPKPTGETPLSQCNVDNVQCCKSTEEAHSLTPETKSLLGGLLGGGGLLSVVLGSLDAQVAKGCSPLSIVGSGNSCSNQPVCCENNSFNGVVALGCTPINISL
ncbi:fungal hydrophobin-domain-containing protein [Infundibulicybe gibba]|nr:fungal hydrophobin-domain-containing protein [Infundibulicybe gibba]